MIHSRQRAAVCITVSALLFLLVSAANAVPAKTFVSKRYAYSLVLPGNSSRWASHLAIANWSSDSIGGIGAPAIDTFSDLLTGRSYLLGARPTGSSLDQWTKFVVSARSSVCGAPKSVEKSSLGGAAARVVTWSCTDGYRVMTIAALHAKRGYFMLVASPTVLSRTSNLHAFDAARRSFHFLKT